MNVNFTLTPDAVGIVSANSKDAVLSAMAERFAQAYDLDAAPVHEGLLEREELGSTGFGRSVALPHARIEGVRRPLAVLLKLEKGVDFDAADQLPVDLAIGLLSPPNAGVAHLHALAALSRMVREDDIHRALLDAPDEDALYALLSDVAERDAA